MESEPAHDPLGANLAALSQSLSLVALGTKWPLKELWTRLSSSSKISGIENSRCESALVIAEFASPWTASDEVEVVMWSVELVGSRVPTVCRGQCLRGALLLLSSSYRLFALIFG